MSSSMSQGQKEQFYETGLTREEQFYGPGAIWQPDKAAWEPNMPV